MRKFIILSACFLLMGLTAASEFTGKVVGVTDGDTIKVLLRDNTTVKIRLEGIDCPEAKQDFGQKAKQTTSALCFGKTVKVVKSGKDRYGRVLGFVYVDGLCINKELLRQGMAWQYTKSNHDKELAKLELDARRRKIGLWSQPNAIAPWEFRAAKKH